MDTQVCEALQGVGQFPRGERTAFIPVGDVSVLAVDAAQGTTGEKDGAGSAASGYGRFFPQMRGNAGNEHLLTEAAEAWLKGTVSTALTRTESAIIHNSKFIIHNYLRVLVADGWSEYRCVFP